MTPPEAPDLVTGPVPPAVLSCPPPITVLRERRDFRRAARGPRHAGTAMVVQARRRAVDEAGSGIRVGFTCSKKVGNAVARNRAKRRLREAARAVLPEYGHAGWDYVLIGRFGATAARPFEALKDDLRAALRHLHNPAKGARA